MKTLYLRLDDACEKMDIDKWRRMETMLDKYSVKPLVGVIPFCEDPSMKKYPFNNDFWTLVKKWISKGWIIAIHGFNHVYSTDSGGINPVNKRSEFAGEPLDIQKSKIRKGVEIFQQNGVKPEVFFAPSHTFDENTLIALKEESDIRIISDTIASKPYYYKGFTFVPQQSGIVRKLPLFKSITFCYHPNTMTEKDFKLLEQFLANNTFSVFPLVQTQRKKSLLDKVLTRFYFLRRN